jgi:pimeloyl-ACP methyl ester carboxylesterase
VAEVQSVRARLPAGATLALVLGAAICAPAAAQPAPEEIGVVVMHGKGGSPTRYVAELATGLELKGYRIANLEMPWSAARSYDVPVASAESEVEAALAQLRAKGAAHLFVAGHSQGGLFALYFGDRHPLDGIIAIAPGGNAASPAYREKLGDAVSRARQLAAAGKADEKTRLLDFEGSRGVYTIWCTPANYLSWFDPDGAMNELRAIKSMNPKVPVLFVAPTGDYPPLQASRQMMFGALPPHTLTRLYEPDSSHLGAPAASIEEIARWTARVAASGSDSEAHPPPPR